LKKCLVGIVTGSIILASSICAAADFEGVGNVPCSLLTSEYEDADAGFKENLIVAVSQWAMGYMTGLNIRLPEDGRRELENFNNATLAEKIFAACRLAPQEPVAVIVTEMYLDAPLFRPAIS
jgi:hypothetical protein